MDHVPDRTTACHEAAHAVAGELLGLRVERVSIVPDDKDGRRRLGHVRWARADSGMPSTEGTLALITATLAGTLGEELDGKPAWLLRHDTGWGDRTQADAAAVRLAIARDGGEASADEIVDRAAWQAAQLVEENREVIVHVADALMQRHTLNGAELRNAMEMVPDWFLGNAEDWAKHNSDTLGTPTRSAVRTGSRASGKSRFPRENLFRGAGQGGLSPTRSASYRAKPADGQGEMLVGHFAVFNVWTEINSYFEGRFLERLAPGMFDKTLRERRDQIRCLFQHGYDFTVCDKPLGPFSALHEDSRGLFYEVPLLDTTYNADLIPGLRANLYGASFRFSVMREEIVENPKASAHNPDRLPERTIKEATLYEGGPVTFGAYAEATAGMRSLTDEFRALQERAVAA